MAPFYIRKLPSEIGVKVINVCLNHYIFFLLKLTSTVFVEFGKAIYYTKKSFLLLKQTVVQR
jgi:hypothetical protein